MTKKIPPKAAPEAEPLSFLGLTPNQVVAFNLARAREWKGWTQDEAAEALEPYLGKLWSKASVSQAERSVGGKFIRQFTADEIVAFARAFDLPIGWFFMPPPPWTDPPGVPAVLDTPDAHFTPLAELLDLVFGTDEQQALLTMRLQTWLRQRPAQLTRTQAQVTNLVRSKTEALAKATLVDLADWTTTLRSMANQFEDLEHRAATSIDDELSVAPTDDRAPVKEPTRTRRREER